VFKRAANDGCYILKLCCQWRLTVASLTLPLLTGTGAAVQMSSQAHLLVVRAVVDVLEGHLQREGEAVVALAHRVGRDPQVGLHVDGYVRPQQGNDMRAQMFQSQVPETGVNQTSKGLCI